MDKNKVIFAILIVIILALFIGASSAFSLFGKQATKLNVTSDDTIHPGDKIKVKLTGDDGNAIANATVNITITNDDGFNKTKNITTNSKGIAKLKFNKEGKYLVNCTYAGDDDHEASNATQNLTVEKEETYDDYTESYYDYGAFYSEQYGGMVYTGEIHEGPDGNYYRHLGYNEWVLAY